jgi:hypothetical protein
MAKPKKEEKSQKERFIEQARKSEADESGEAFERAIDAILTPKNQILDGQSSKVSKDRKKP